MTPEKRTITTNRKIPPALITASILVSARPVRGFTDPHRRRHTKEAPASAIHDDDLYNRAYKDSAELNCDPDTAQDGRFPPAAGPTRNIGTFGLSDKKPPPAPRHNIIR